MAKVKLWDLLLWILFITMPLSLLLLPLTWFGLIENRVGLSTAMLLISFMIIVFFLWMILSIKESIELDRR